MREQKKFPPIFKKELITKRYIHLMKSLKPFKRHFPDLVKLYGSALEKAGHIVPTPEYAPGMFKFLFDEVYFDTDMEEAPPYLRRPGYTDFVRYSNYLKSGKVLTAGQSDSPPESILSLAIGDEERKKFERLLPYLKKKYYNIGLNKTKNKFKPLYLALCALEKMELIKVVKLNQTELHKVLSDEFGEIGGRQAVNNNVGITLNKKDKELVCALQQEFTLILT